MFKKSNKIYDTITFQINNNIISINIFNIPNKSIANNQKQVLFLDITDNFSIFEIIFFIAFLIELILFISKFKSDKYLIKTKVESFVILVILIAITFCNEFDM